MSRRNVNKKKKRTTVVQTSERIRVKKIHSEQFILTLKELGTYIYQVFTIQDPVNFTLIKLQVQNLSSQIIEMPFTLSEKKTMREAAQQIAIIPNLSDIEEVRTKLNTLFDVITPLAIRMGVEVAANPIVEAALDSIMVEQEEEISTISSVAITIDPTVLVNLMRILPFYLKNAITQPNINTQTLLETLFNGIVEQIALLGNTPSHNERLQTISNDVIMLLRHTPYSETHINEQINDFRSALSVSIGDLNIPADARASLLQSLENVTNLSAIGIHDDIVQQKDESAQVEETIVTEEIDAIGVSEAGDSDEICEADPMGETNVTTDEIGTIAIGEVKASGELNATAGTDEPGTMVATEQTDTLGETGETGDLSIIEECEETGDSEVIDMAEEIGESGRTVEEILTMATNEIGANEETGDIEASAAPEATRVTCKEITIGGTLLYNSDGVVQTVIPHAPIIFDHSTLHGIAFNGTTTLTIDTAGFYYFDWEVSLEEDQVAPITFGIVIDGNTASTVNMKTNTTNHGVFGSAVINLAIGSTVELYNLSALSKEISALSVGARLSIYKVGS